MIASLFNNELITSYESERVPSNSIKLHTTKIVWYDTRHDFPSNLSDRVSRASGLKASTDKKRGGGRAKIEQWV